jgi:hypothetical protein
MRLSRYQHRFHRHRHKFNRESQRQRFTPQ